MKNNGILYGDSNKISWSYVQKLEAYNSSQFPRYCPRLTHNHVYLQAFKEMNVAKAAHVSKLLYNIRDFLDMALSNPARYHKKVTF